MSQNHSHYCYRKQSRQVFDIPPIKISVTEHRAEQACCQHCNATITASFPPEVKAPTQYGPNLKATCLYFSGFQLLPYKRLTTALSDLFATPISEGTLRNILATAGKRAKEVTSSILEALQESIGL